MACHRFVSHVTGFATFFGHEINQPDSSHALGMLVVPLFFLIGTMLSGFLVDIRLKQHKTPKYYLSFGIIFLLISTVFVSGVSGQLGVFGQPINTAGDYILLILLCLTCGIQNGSVTTVSKSVIRTTHLTGITTDLGIGLMRLINSSKLQEDLSNEKKAIVMRMGIIFFFGLGSVVGGFAFQRLGYLGFFIPLFTSGFLFLAMIYYHFSSGKKL